MSDAPPPVAETAPHELHGDERMPPRPDMADAIGWLALGSVPTLLQCLGLVIVLAGFRLTQRN